MLEEKIKYELEHVTYNRLNCEEEAVKAAKKLIKTLKEFIDGDYEFYTWECFDDIEHNYGTLECKIDELDKCRSLEKLYKDMTATLQKQEEK